MKRIIFTFFFILYLLDLSAQIDTSFYMSRYPTGQDGLVRDIEAFAHITIEEKDTLIGVELEITLIVLADGKVDDVFVRGPVSEELKSRIEASFANLHDFIPARSNGETVKSTFITTFIFSDYHSQSYLRRNASAYEEKTYGWSIDYGIYAGNFTGNISEVYGGNLGLYFGTGLVFENNLINFDFGIGGAYKNGNFVLPPEVIEESNNAHFFYGVSYSRYFDTKPNQSFRTKIGIGGYSINAGLISESNLYRLIGFDIFGEFAYAFKVGEQTSSSYYNVSRYKHYITPFTQLHLWSGEEQSKGLFFNVGVRYSLEIFGMQFKK